VAMPGRGPDPNKSFALVATYAHPNRQEIRVYIGNMHAYQNLQKIHSRLDSICCYGCDSSDDNVKAVPKFLDTENTHHQPKEKAVQKILDGAKLVQKSFENGRDILVHCHMGMNRSAAIIAAWAMIYKHESFNLIHKKLKIANATRNLPVLTNKIFRDALKNNSWFHAINLQIQEKNTFSENQEIKLQDSQFPVVIRLRPEIWTNLPHAAHLHKGTKFY
tara:strand:+ start:9035 stop:9691 length:657 start_codon:yes stop_codon:yes gene_type:complete